ncbi:MEDS domain-containing protein [Dactylosporangium sp. NPDC000521]|uniref:MEDS domain-containing protein n=1 Tax=Dactylosporangium sp. NPDC000521 TaxID=3363975 RepID=UPI003695FCFB
MVEVSAPVLGGAGTPVTHEHHCVVFDDPGEFRVRSGRFVAAGLAAGQRIMYIGAGDPAGLSADMAGVDGFTTALLSGQASVAAVDAMYELGLVFDPQEQVDLFAVAARTALADGYTGLRVAADVSALAGDPRHGEAYLRYEHLIDRFMSGHPVHGMCGVRRDAVSPDALAAVACLHPRIESVAVPFQLYCTGQPPFGVVLAGEVDLAAQSLFASALRVVDLPGAGGELVIDARRLSFIDHQRLLQLAAWLRDAGTTGVLYTTHGSVLHTMVELLELRELRVTA